MLVCPTLASLLALPPLFAILSRSSEMTASQFTYSDSRRFDIQGDDRGFVVARRPGMRQIPLSRAHHHNVAVSLDLRARVNVAQARLRRRSDEWTLQSERCFESAWPGSGCAGCLRGRSVKAVRSGSSPLAAPRLVRNRHGYRREVFFRIFLGLNDIVPDSRDEPRDFQARVFLEDLADGGLFPGCQAAPTGS